MEQERSPISTNMEFEVVDDKQPGSVGIGRMLVVYKSETRTVTIGPDYCFFIWAFLGFCTLSFFVIKTCLWCSNNIYFQIATIFLSLFQPYSYLSVALSDPGIITHSTVEPSMANPDAANEVYGRSDIRYCKFCDIYVTRSTRHCSDCQLCIDEYDHHCPWVTKCIGKKNLVKFYVFVTMTPIFIVYGMLVLSICMTIQLEAHLDS